MAERANPRAGAAARRGTLDARIPHEPSALPILTGAASALSPLAGRRILVTIGQPAQAGETRPLADDMAFEDAIAFAAHLASLDAEIILVAVGEVFTPEDLRAIARVPGASAWSGGAIISPQENAAACAAQLGAAAQDSRADLLILHEPALAAVRDRRPTVAFCASSRFIAWRQRHGGAPAPESLRTAAALERIGLQAADRVIAPTRAMAAQLVAMHGLALPPTIAPPIFHKPEAHPKRERDSGIVVAGALQADPDDLLSLDRAAAQVCGQTLLFDMSPRDAGHTLCMEQIHRLPPMTAESAEALLLRAAAFYAPSSGELFDPLVWRAASAGCAMILPDTKGHKELWQDAAFFVQPRAESELAAALRRMLEDEDCRRRMAAAGLRRARALANGPAIAGLDKALASALGQAPLTAAF